MMKDTGQDDHMDNSGDDEVVQAMKAELLAFLLDRSAPSMPAGRSPTLADAIGETVSDRVSDQLDHQIHQFRSEVVATLAEERVKRSRLRSRILSPWFLVPLFVAVLSIGGNIGLGIALFHDRADKTDATDKSEALDSQSAQPVDIDTTQLPAAGDGNGDGGDSGKTAGERTQDDKKVGDKKVGDKKVGDKKADVKKQSGKKKAEGTH